MPKIFNISLFALLLAIFATFASSEAFAIDADIYEPDNNFTDANAISTNGSLQHHSFHAGGDEDWINFNATNKSVYNIETTNLLNNADTFIYLYDSDGTTLIDSNDDIGGDNLASRMVYPANANKTNYIKIRHFSSSGTGNYSIYVKEIKKDQYEPDDNFTEAKEILKNGSLQTHTFIPAGDEDWANFSAIYPNIYTIETSNLQNGADTIIFLYKSDGTTLIKSDNDGGSEFMASKIVHQANSTETYYTKIKAFNNKGGGIYGLSAVEKIIPMDEYEPDDSYAQAKEIKTNGTRQNHTTHIAGDTDFMKFNGTAQKVYAIETNNLLNNTDTLIELYDSDGTTTLIKDDHSGNEPKSSLIVFNPSAAATYYLSATSTFPGQDYGQFDISVKKFEFAKDSFEPDNNAADAKQISADGQPQKRTIFSANDIDYLKFNAVANNTYKVETSNLNLTDTNVTLLDTDGTSIIAFDDNSGGEKGSSKILFKANKTGTYFVEVKDVRNTTAGGYDISILGRGTLSGLFVQPKSNITVARNNFFTIIAKVNCTGAICGNVTATLDPQKIIAYEPSNQILLKSRIFLPDKMGYKPIRAPTEPSIAAAIKKEHFLIQLENIISEEEKEMLENRGVDFLRYIPNKAWLVSSTTEEITKIPNIRWYGKLESDDKISPNILDNNIGGWSINPDGDLTLLVQFYQDVEIEKAEEIARDSGGDVINVIKSLNTLAVKISKENIGNLASEDEVMWIGESLPLLSPVNDEARSVTGAETLQKAPYNLDGTDITVFVYDGGLAESTHGDLAGRVTLAEPGPLESHATHVACTVGGSGARSQNFGGTALQWRGMAPNVKIISGEYDTCSPFCLYNSSNDIQEDYSNAISFHNVDIATNSIGSNVAPNGYPCEWEGDYELTSQLVDGIIRGNLGKPLPGIWANGNERSSGRCGASYGTTAPPAGMKNSVSVGATNKDDTISSYTSFGPTDDGRIKPDVTAPGTSLFSCNTGNGYTTMSGTSMATPATTGNVALMMQAYRQNHNGKMLPSTIKGLLIHTSDDLGNSGPDYKFGYGRINSVSAISTIQNDSMSNAVIFEGNISQNGNMELSANVPGGKNQFKITLVWSDYPGTPLVQKELVNDLDIVILSPSGIRFYPWTLDPSNPALNAVRDKEDHTNNVEQVLVDNPEKGLWKIIISGTVVPNGPQEFSLVSDFKMLAGKGAIPMNFGNPFYTINQNPVFPSNLSCLKEMGGNTECQQAWMINATGKAGTTWKFFAAYENDITEIKTEIFHITIDNAPKFNNTPLNESASVGKKFEFNVTASDEDISTINDKLNFLTSDNLKYNLTNISNTKATILFTPTEDDFPEANLTVFVKDSFGLNDSQYITMIVNDAPVLDLMPNKTIEEDTALEFNITARDPDLEYGDVLSFSSNDSRFAPSKVNSTAATVNFAATNDNVGAYTVKFRVIDIVGAESVQALTINVTNVNDAPIIESFYPTHNGPKIHNSTSIKFNVSASDPDEIHGDALTILWHINGILNKTGNSFNFTPDGKIGAYGILANASDKNGYFTTREWNLIVADRPIVSSFNPDETTNFPSIGDLSSVSNVKLGKPEGKILFNENLDLRFAVDFDNLINISKGYISIDTSKLPELNKSAKLIMRELEFSQKPSIMADDGNGFILCPSELCKDISYLGNNLSFDVSHFSAYKAVENTTKPTPPSKLSIKKVKAIIDGSSETVQEGEKIDDVKPGSEVKLKIKAKSLFSNGDDLDIEDISVELSVEDMDDGDNLEEEADEFDLGADDEEEIEIEFTVPFDVEEDTYDILITAEGEDENKTMHKSEFNFELEVEKESHEIKISRLDLSPSKISCSKNAVALNLEAVNSGSNDEESVVVSAYSPDLSLDFKEEAQLDENEAFSRSVGIETPLSQGVLPGIYPINAKVYYGSNKLSDEKTINLEVEECTKEETKEMAASLKAASGKQPVEVLYADTRKEEQNLAALNAKSDEDDDEFYVVLLLVSHIILIGLIIFLAGVLIIPKKR